jgi:hypothetical protein
VDSREQKSSANSEVGKKGIKRHQFCSFLTEWFGCILAGMEKPGCKSGPDTFLRVLLEVIMPQPHARLQGHISAKTVNSSSDHLASSVRFPNVKAAPATGTEQYERKDSTKKPTCPASSSSATILPMTVSGFPLFVKTVTFKQVLEFFHIRNLPNASSEEAIFLHVLYGQIATQARLLAAILPWSLQRPLQALHEAMNESEQNCSGKSVKRKRPSGSPASSKRDS